MRTTLSPPEQRLLLDIARDRIESEIAGRPPRCLESTTALERKCGAFVTLRLAPTKALRGCIGQVMPTTPLRQVVSEMAYSSAFRDPRFSPLSLRELCDLSIEISVLSCLEVVDNPALIVPGVHGVMIEQGRRSGLLLPQVAGDRGWDRDTLMRQLCRKAGLPIEALTAPDVAIHRFTAQVFDDGR